MRIPILEIITLLTMSAIAGEPAAPAIIPLPRSIESREGSFGLGPQTSIAADVASTETARYLAERLRQATGYKLNLAMSAEPKPASGGILLTTAEAKPDLGAEGYELTVNKDSVVIRAPAQAGVYYGIQSLLELLPPDVFASKPIHPGGLDHPLCADPGSAAVQMARLHARCGPPFLHQGRGETTAGCDGLAQDSTRFTCT